MKNETFREKVWCEKVLKGTEKLWVILFYRSSKSTQTNNDDLIGTINRALKLKCNHCWSFGDTHYKGINSCITLSKKTIFISMWRLELNFKKFQMFKFDFYKWREYDWLWLLRHWFTNWKNQSYSCSCRSYMLFKIWKSERFQCFKCHYQAKCITDKFIQEIRMTNLDTKALSNYEILSSV